MTDLHMQLVGHLVKRSAVLVRPFKSVPCEAKMEALQESASAYERSGVQDINPIDLLPMLATFLIFLISYVSLKYTLGEVMAALAMIEQPRTSVMIAKSDVSATKTAGLKDGLLDEELVMIQEKPVTSSIRTTLQHLRGIGGFRARFRGLSIAIIYTCGQSKLAYVFGSLFGLLPIWTPLAMCFGSIVSTLCLVRVHMTWTHIMISEPSPLAWYRRIPRGRSYFRALLVPAFVFALAQNLTVVLPMMVFVSFGKPTSSFDPEHNVGDAKSEIARLLATLASSLFVAIAVYLPATVTLTRVEASLLPDDVETIVHFDRTLGGAATNLVGFGKINFIALYDAAWRSFDKASRVRLIKFYVKYNLVMLALCMFFGLAIVAEVFVLGVPRLQVFAESASAQLQLINIETNLL